MCAYYRTLERERERERQRERGEEETQSKTGTEAERDQDRVRMRKTILVKKLYWTLKKRNEIKILKKKTDEGDMYMSV